MRYAGHFVRKGILEKLVGNIDLGSGIIPVYGRVPDNATYPYIMVKTADTSEIDQNQSTYTSSVNTTIEVVTRYDTDDGGQTISNQIANVILTLIRKRSIDYMDLSDDGFSVYGQEFGGVTNLEESYSDSYYYRTIINFVVKVEQTSLDNA